MMKTETWRLRGTLRIAITCLPLLGGCTKSTRGGAEAPPVRAHDAGAHVETPRSPPADAAVAVTPGTAATPAELAAACTFTHTASGTAAMVKPFVVGTAVQNGCPTQLSGVAANTLRFNLDFGQIQGFALDTRCTAAHQKSDPTICVYAADVSYPPEGRPAIEAGHAVVAPVRAAARWRRGKAPQLAGLSPAERARLAAEWLATARAEHASVASFARATLELMAVAAPPALLAACSRAAIDEVRHAELAFALASHYAGQPLDPGPLPSLTPRGGGLAELARDTFAEGCVAETAALLRAQRALAAASDPAVRQVLTRIVRDETRHAELAWQTVAWAIGSGGPEVLAAVHAAAREAQPATAAQAWDEVIGPSLALLG